MAETGWSTRGHEETPASLAEHSLDNVAFVPTAPRTPPSPHTEDPGSPTSKPPSRPPSGDRVSSAGSGRSHVEGRRGSMRGEKSPSLFDVPKAKRRSRSFAYDVG
eukprot:CAMPEP_0118952840 /NCGR_PEP_ID=MMETSP1169-20130426/55550_1 /TAXON_ID=36882 /ORGANISM="Pyramimonas obovata, Strain CCMP722" /LENGTH=104 /DNA_ID=CAMNT_0006900175 /DNA_START=410 /DNA_END=720 /DNA_ORIENTATION=+